MNAAVLWRQSRHQNNPNRRLAMKTFSLLAIFLMSSLSTFAQNLSVSGLVKNQQNEGVPFATVALYQANDSTLVKVETCTENGGFNLGGIKPDRYFMLISSVGYQKYRSLVVELFDTGIDFQTIILLADNQLNEVKIKAQKPLIEVMADKTVFNVQSSLAATGTTALELLRKSPGVLLDNNENIVLEGKTGVLIFLDGKPSILMGQDLNEFLKSLQASDIEAIEIITQPSSKYDAAGNAGIINIRLKKDKRFGTNGSLSTGYSYGQFGKWNNSLSLNHRTRKANLYGTYSNRFGKNWSFINLKREQVNTIFDQRSETIGEASNHNAKLGLDYFLSKKSTFGVIFNLTTNDYNGTTLSRTPIIPQSTNQIQQVLLANNLTALSNYNAYLNTNYRFADTLGHELNIDVDLGRYDRQRTNNQPNLYRNASETETLFSRIYFMDTPTGIGVLTVKADYEQRLWKGKMGLGAKLSVVATDNTFNFFDVVENRNVLNTSRSNNFQYKEQISAAYLNYDRKFKKTNLQLGLRVEQTLSEGNLTSTQNNSDARVKRNYTNLFPSGGVTYNASPNNSFALTYSRRIERPTYQSLNPFEWPLDEISYQKGNAFLQPQYVDNLKLSHTHKYTLTTSLSYSFVRDFFAQITDTTGFNRNFLMEQNIANQQVVNLGVTYPAQLNKWWNAFLSLNAYHTRFDSDNPKFIEVQANVLSFYGQNTFNLPRKWILEISGWYSSPGIWGGTYITRSQGALDIALQKKIFNDEISMRLAMSDLFFTSPWRGTTQFGAVRINGSGGWESRQFRVNLSYNFGNKQVKSATQRQTGLEEEKNRMN